MYSGSSAVRYWRWNLNMSRITQAADTSLDTNVLHSIHCFTVTLFRLGRSFNSAWQHALRWDERYSDESTTGTYLDNKRRSRLFGAASCPFPVGLKPPLPHDRFSLTLTEKILAQLFGGKLFTMIAIESPSSGDFYSTESFHCWKALRAWSLDSSF